MAPALSKEFLDIQATVECGFTLKLVRDMIKTYNVPANLSNLKSKVDKLDVDKLVPVDLSKLSGTVKKDVYNAKINNIEDKIPDITNVATNATFKAKINEVKGKIPIITNVATATAFTAAENEIPNVNNIVKKN